MLYGGEEADIRCGRRFTSCEQISVEPIAKPAEVSVGYF